MKNFIFLVFFFVTPTAWADLTQKQTFDLMVAHARCVLQDVSCNLSVSGIDSRDPEQDASVLIEKLLLKGAIKYNGGPSPVNSEYVTLAECQSPWWTGCTGWGSRVTIYIYDDLYKNKYKISFKTAVLLHEVGHAAGLDHPTFEDSEEWNRVILSNCFTSQLRHSCQVKD